MAGAPRLSHDQLRTLDRLKPLCEALGLYLAGGTAIALHLGHRTSRDIDLFTRQRTADFEVVRGRFANLTGAEIDAFTETALHGRVDMVPVDVVNYSYPLLCPTVEGPSGLAVASLEDLSVMKLAAIARRGIRRDFWDLYEILRSGAIALPQALASYTRRYGVKDSDLYHVLRSLTFFDDAEADTIMPDGLTTERWRVVRQYFLDHVPPLLRAYLVD